MNRELTIEDRVVDKDDYNSLECSLCISLMDNPRICCSNGHMFCLKCVKSLLERKVNKCPQCRSSISADKLSRNILAENLIRSLMVHCSNHFKYNEQTKNWDVDLEGCKEITTLEKMGAHQMVCPFELVECPIGFDKCFKIRKDHLDNHLLECPYRLLNCNLCNKQIRFKDTDAHIQNECEVVEIKCMDCHEPILRSNEKDHSLNCPNQIVPCPLGSICNFQGKRKDLTNHMIEATNIHLQSQAFTYTKQIQDMEQRIKILEDNLSYFTFNWSVRRVLKDDRAIQSGVLKFGGFHWELTIGRVRENISFFVQLLSDVEYSVNTNIQSKFHVNGTQPFSRGLTYSFKTGDGRGWTSIVTKSMMENAEFKKKDKIKIIFKAKVLSIKKKSN